MRNFAVAVALCSALGMPSAPLAQTGVEPFLRSAPSRPPESGLSVGVRAAYGVPLGSASGVAGDELSKLFSGSFPLMIDLGWRFSPSWYVGGYFQYAFLTIASSSPFTTSCSAAGVSCSGTDLRFGVDVVYTILPYATIVPWVGVGAGYEISKFTASGAGQSAELTFKGWEFGHVSIGADYRVVPKLRVGPFATITFAQYDSAETPIDPNTGQIGATRSYDISQKALHEWLLLGIRAMLDF